MYGADPKRYVSGPASFSIAFFGLMQNSKVNLNLYTSKFFLNECLVWYDGFACRVQHFDKIKKGNITKVLKDKV